MSFSARLKELRIERGFTQKLLAARLNLSPNSICEWEKKRCEPSFDSLVRIAEIFEVTTDYLLGREDDFGNVTVENTELSENEQKLLEDYRSLPRQEKVQAEEYVHYLAERRGLNKKKA